MAVTVSVSAVEAADEEAVAEGSSDRVANLSSSDFRKVSSAFVEVRTNVGSTCSTTSGPKAGQ